MTTRTTAEGFARENSLLRHALKAVVVLILAVLSLPGVIPIAFGFLLQSCFRRPMPNLLMAPLGAALAWLTWTLWHWSPVTIVIHGIPQAPLSMALSGMFATFGTYLCQQWRKRR